MGTDRPDPADEPFFFLKPPTTSIIGPNDPVPYPAGVPELDWEAELAVIISHRVRNLDASDVSKHIAGYTIANDISARGAFRRPQAVLAPFAFDWFAHKGQDGFCPLGPGIVPAWLVPDPQSLPIKLWVNDELKQDSTTADMVVGVAELVAAASRLVTLEPGDVVLTGTPAGVGMPKDSFLKPGDDILIEIAGIGQLRNRIADR
jgi:2-keto-4-pentenoate hydratase/2-oxohepta-3-ene-1,7-dioic acid hydratase in catechol pathway